MASELTWKNLNTIFTATGPAYINQKIEDIYFDGHPFLAMIKANGGIKLVNKTGKKLVQRVGVGRNNTGAWRSTRTQQVPEAQETMTTAEFPWSSWTANITFFDEDLHDNMGDAEMADLVQAAVDQSLDTLDEDLSIAIGGGEGNNTGNEFRILGLKNAVADGTHVNPPDYGGLSVDTYDGWKAQVKDNGVDRGDLVPNMGNVYNSATRGSKQPKLVLTSQEGYESYENSMSGNIEYATVKIGDASFQGLNFRGKPVMFDRDVSAITSAPTGWNDTGELDDASTDRFYFLRPEDWVWAFDAAWSLNNAIEKEFRAPHNQFNRTKLMAVRSQLICKMRRQQGLLHSVPRS